MSDIRTCGECGKAKPVMVVLRSPKGPWALCAGCMADSLHENAAARAEREEQGTNLARREKKRAFKVGSH